MAGSDTDAALIDNGVRRRDREAGGRADRLAAAMRENLRRRKAQRRSRDAAPAPGGPGVDPGPSGPPGADES